jgi:hypothetical protein
MHKPKPTIVLCVGSSLEGRREGARKIGDGEGYLIYEYRHVSQGGGSLEVQINCALELRMSKTLASAPKSISRIPGFFRIFNFGV